MKQNLLILGANSFFAQSIINYIYLKRKNYEKKINHIILFSKNKNKNKNIKKLQKYFKITLIEDDILKIKSLPDCKYIIYCILLKNFRKDFLAVKNFIKILKKTNKKKSIIYTSSGAVYGKNFEKNEKIKENLKLKYDFNYNTYKKKYSYYKLKSEKLFLNLKKTNFKVSILRCFAFVGKNLPNNKKNYNNKFAVMDLINSVIQSKTILIKSNFLVIRSYMHQNDLANWILTIILKMKKNFSIYNFGSDDEISLHNLGLFLAKKYNLNFKSNFLKINNIKKKDIYIPNLEKVKKTFKLKLNFNSIQAVLNTIREIKKQK